MENQNQSQTPDENRQSSNPSQQPNYPQSPADPNYQTNPDYASEQYEGQLRNPSTDRNNTYAGQNEPGVQNQDDRNRPTSQPSPERPSQYDTDDADDMSDMEDDMNDDVSMEDDDERQTPQRPNIYADGDDRNTPGTDRNQESGEGSFSGNTPKY